MLTSRKRYVTVVLVSSFEKILLASFIIAVSSCEMFGFGLLARERVSAEGVSGFGEGPVGPGYFC